MKHFSAVQRCKLIETVISPNLFISTLEHVIRNIKFEPEEGLKIDGEILYYLAFADDIVLLANSSRSLESMLRKLYAETNQVGLKIHPGKTKWMTNQGPPHEQHR